MTKNKYLDNLGIPMDKYGTNFMPDDDERMPKWEEEKKEWGFDSRETWNMDRIFIEWLYSHLMMYKETNGEKMKESVGLLIKYKGENQSHTFGEWIQILLNSCKTYLLSDTCSFADDETINQMIEACHIFAEILPSLWIKKKVPSDETLKNQTELYGFNETEVYKFYSEFIDWFYKHIKMFNEVNNIDTEKDKLYYHENNKEQVITMQQGINYFLETCRNYYRTFDIKEITTVLHIWAEVFPAFWW